MTKVSSKSCRCGGINQTKLSRSVIAGKQYGVRIAHYSDVRNLLAVSLRQCKAPPQIIHRNL
jgi:hypothetical protein